MTASKPKSKAKPYTVKLEIVDSSQIIQKPKSKAKLPASREIDLPPRNYQPSKAELEEEHDMPKAKMATLRRAFFRPFSIRESR